MAESAILLYTSFILRPSHCPAFDITEKQGEGRSACFYQENVVSVYLEQKWDQNELEVFYCSICPGIGVANVHKVENSILINVQDKEHVHKMYHFDQGPLSLSVCLGRHRRHHNQSQ